MIVLSGSKTTFLLHLAALSVYNLLNLTVGFCTSGIIVPSEMRQFNGITLALTAINKILNM